MKPGDHYITNDPWKGTGHLYDLVVVSPTFIDGRIVAQCGDGMLEVLDAEPRLTGGPVERWSERPVTKFERKGLAVGREITDLCYRRLPSPA